MAKRMNFSVVGLPHYTIWHLYEPSVNDLRHMEEMERERRQREEEEKRKEKMQEQFRDTKEEWEHDSAAARKIAMDAADKEEKKDKSEDQKRDGS